MKIGFDSGLDSECNALSIADSSSPKIPRTIFCCISIFFSMIFSYVFVHLHFNIFFCWFRIDNRDLYDVGSFFSIFKFHFDFFHWSLDHWKLNWAIIDYPFKWGNPNTFQKPFSIFSFVKYAQKIVNMIFYMKNEIYEKKSFVKVHWNMNFLAKKNYAL